MFNYHDLGHMGVDRARMNKAVFAALKPGGMYVIADHSGRPGTGISEAGTLHRIEEGAFGVCMRCEEDINPKRLHAVPWTPYCIQCQELADRIRSGPYGDYVLAVGRLETVKRAHLAIEAMAHVDAPMRLVVVGDGTQRANTEALVERLGLGDRVRLAGAVSNDELLALYEGALAVVYPPFDEDFGYVTLEAFLARRPVVTTSDAGGPLEFVQDGVNGAVVPPDPEALAAAINRYGADRRRAAEHGAAGRARASLVTWDGVIEALVGDGPDRAGTIE